MYYKRAKENKDGSQRYTCSNDDCSASITVLNDEIVKINGKLVQMVDEEKVKTSHKNNHVSLSDQEIMKMEFKRTMKVRVRNENLPIQQLYQEEQTKIIRKVGDMEILAKAVPQYENISGGLYKEKAKVIPVIPDTIEEIVIKDDWAMCEDGKRSFLLFQDSSMIIFCSDVGLKILAKSTRWQCDGTFKVVPKGFKQLYGIHAYYKWQLYPCAFALLTGKDSKDYEQLIQHLKEGALRHRLVLKPKTLMIDFEAAFMKAFDYHFPDAVILGCYFHLGKWY